MHARSASSLIAQIIYCYFSGLSAHGGIWVEYYESTSPTVYKVPPFVLSLLVKTYQ
jgi:hypothetical protein